MPSAQVIDLNPGPRGPATPLEKTLSAFASRNTADRADARETDALREIYDQYQQDGSNLEATIKGIQTKPGLSPTTRVNTVKQLLDFQEHNGKLQKKAQEDAEKAEKKLRNQAQIRDIETRRGEAPGSGDAYIDDPSKYAALTKPPKEGKGNQADRQIDPDQLKRIEHITSRPDFMEASPSQQNLMLLKGGVSKENSKAVIEPLIEEAKLGTQRDETINKKQAEADFGFVEEQVSKIPSLVNRQQTLEAADALNEQGVTGQNWDIAMQKAGLVQYTSDGFREFSSHAKDSVKNQNIKSVIGSQISQMEFGFFRDATINPNFSKEANRRIIDKEKLAIRYEKLYSDITEKLVEQNEGKIPPNIQSQVNKEFALQAEKISKEVRKAAIEFEAIQNVPDGFTLMYNKRRKPLHVPNDQVKQATLEGATST